MNVVLQISQIDPDNIQIMEKKTNKTMEGNFAKILYSNEHITINGLYVAFPLNMQSMNKTDGSFATIQENLVIINQINEIEQRILEMYRNLYLPMHTREALTKGEGPALKRVIFNQDIQTHLSKQTIHYKIAPKMIQTPYAVFKKEGLTVLKIIGVTETESPENGEVSIGLQYAFLQIKNKL